MSRLCVEVIYAANLKPGDLYAGRVVPDAPTRPVQPMAAAMTLTRVTKVTRDDGRKWIALDAGRLGLTSVLASSQVLVIRDVLQRSSTP